MKSLVWSPKEYYHVTTKEAWESIQKEGLVPRIGERSKKIREPIPAVYLFESEAAMLDAVHNWLGEEFEDAYGEDCDMVVLKVMPPAGILLDESVAAEFEVRCYEPIPKECIEFVSDDDF